MKKTLSLSILSLIVLCAVATGCKRHGVVPEEGNESASDAIIKAKIIRAGAESNDPVVLEKDEFLHLMDEVTPAEQEKIERILFGKDIDNTKRARMETFRTTYFKGYSLKPLFGSDIDKDEIRLVSEYTTDALNRNKFEFKNGTKISDPYNQTLFTDGMVGAFGAPVGDFLYLCVGHNQVAPKIEGIRILQLPKPTETKDGLKYMPGSALNDRECIVYVPRPWFGAGSQHKGFYPHDYSVTLQMLIELANTGDTEFMDMISDSFVNFNALAESIGHIPNANKSWSIGDTSRTQTNSLTSQVLLYAKRLKETEGKKTAEKWLKETGIPIARNNLDFFTAARAKTDEGLYLFIPIGMTPDAEGGDTYAYTVEMNTNPVLQNFYFERLLDDLIATYEDSITSTNFCSDTDCTKYIEIVTDKETIGKLKPRNLVKMVEAQARINDLSPEATVERMKLAKAMDGRVFSWNHPIRGEEIVIKSPAGKYYRLTNYAIGSDQAMRASGFDPSDMAGINSLDALDTAYAGHNSQLYRQMKDMAAIYGMTDNEAASVKWNEKANELKKAILANMWSPSHGELVAYHRDDGRVDYRFFDESYSLWAGLFDIDKKDERVMLMSTVRNIPDYEGPEGPYAGTDWSGHNWGWGKVWPVMAAYSFMGLRNYAAELDEAGFEDEAKLCEDTAQRIALKWLYSNAEMFAKEYGFGENLAVRTDGKPLENCYGYNIDPKKAGNYTWHVTITRWFYPQLNAESEKAFETFYAALKAEHPDKL